jgi:hypothetical protein
VARPMPEAPPVTSARRPANSASGIGRLHSGRSVRGGPSGGSGGGRCGAWPRRSRPRRR